MAEIRPFQGVHYDKQRAGDLAAVICPPYDIITPRMREELYRRSRHNFARLELGQELPGDTDAENKYTRGAAALKKWLEQGVLREDGAPALYRHDHQFTCHGKTYRRRGITALVRLEEWGSMVVRPHEGTLSRPRGDRLNLLWALQANTSPIFALYEDRGRQVAALLEDVPDKPLLEVDWNGERHQVGAIAGGAAGEIRRLMADQPLYIADGHHRYESALAYRRERRACSPSLSSEEPFDFVMMTLVDFADPGLLILPAHRLVRGIPRPALDRLQAALPAFFEVTRVALGRAETVRQVKESLLAEDGQVKLVLFGLAGDSLSVVRLRDFAAAGRLMPSFHSELYRKLDVSIVDHVLLESMLGMGDRESASLDYSYDVADAVGRVLSGECQLAILLNPVRAGAIKSIADAGDRMPRKSTYFYPKLPAGLLFYRWE